MATSVFLSSGNLLADRRFEWARDALEKNDLEGAADLLAQAVEMEPGFASAWFTLGELRAKQDDRAGAVAAFEKAKATDPQDRHGASLHLAKLGVNGTDGMPAAYVRALFDGYASRFDDALTGALDYTAPELLRDAVQAYRETFTSMLDLGCGTGLAGESFRELAGEIVGVDLSSAMLAQARAKGVYARLAEDDVVSFLAAEAEAGRCYDLIVAADVFVYLGDLAPVLTACARTLTPGGILAFTCETHDGSGILLRETLRYAHAPAYVRGVLSDAGLNLLRLDPASTRTEKSEPVPGLLIVAEKPR